VAWVAVLGGVDSKAGNGLRWYAVKTQQRKEALAQLHLRRQNFETFTPVVLQPVRAHSGFVSRKIALFPGYLFTRLDLAIDRWRCINSTTGVSRLVEFAGRPAPAPRGLVEFMQERASDEGEVSFSEEIAVGSHVRVIGGPFDGIIGILQRGDASARVRVLMDLMERQVSVSVPRSLVVAASQ
jgi:transcriptional antiterminator RfaH